jgi:hypothetical protein
VTQGCTVSFETSGPYSLPIRAEEILDVYRHRQSDSDILYLCPSRSDTILGGVDDGDASLTVSLFDHRRTGPDLPIRYPHGECRDKE